jgi:hypothetical protein
VGRRRWSRRLGSFFVGNGRERLGDWMRGRSRRGFHGGRRGGDTPAAVAEMSSYLLCNVVVQGAGMRFLVGDSQGWQEIQDQVRLHFQLSGQFIDSNLLHKKNTKTSPPFYVIMTLLLPRLAVLGSLGCLVI